MLCVLTAFISVIFMETLSFDDVWRTPLMVIGGQFTDFLRTIRSAVEQWFGRVPSCRYCIKRDALTFFAFCLNDGDGDDDKWYYTAMRYWHNDLCYDWERARVCMWYSVFWYVDGPTVLSVNARRTSRFLCCTIIIRFLLLYTCV